MRPKTEKRRLRGIEVAQAALLLVIGVVIALVLYYVVLGMVRSTPAPDVQLDPYSSFVDEKRIIMMLKFGKTATVTKAWLLDRNGDLISDNCYPAPIHYVSFPLTVYEGQKYGIRCDLPPGKTWDTKMIMRLQFADGRIVNVPWVIG